jgi:multidrug transporter EmrE-like cation transporter
MNIISLRAIGLFCATLVGQLCAIALLPRTRGFVAPLPTMACVAAFVFSIWMISRLAHEGTSLGILIPLLNAIIPLGTVAIGVLGFGESASLSRIAMLLVACVLIGVASRLH